MVWPYEKLQMAKEQVCKSQKQIISSQSWWTTIFDQSGSKVVLGKRLSLPLDPKWLSRDKGYGKRHLLWE